MEKFSKFDDPSCGLNPFIPIQKTLAKAQQLKPWQAHGRMVCKVFLLALRLPCVLLAVVMWLFLHVWKFVGVIPLFIRWIERFNDKMIAQLLMNITSFNNIKE